MILRCVMYDGLHRFAKPWGGHQTAHAESSLGRDSSAGLCFNATLFFTPTHILSHTSLQMRLCDSARAVLQYQHATFRETMASYHFRNPQQLAPRRPTWLSWPRPSFTQFWWSSQSTANGAIRKITSTCSANKWTAGCHWTIESLDCFKHYLWQVKSTWSSIYRHCMLCDACPCVGWIT